MSLDKARAGQHPIPREIIDRLIQTVTQWFRRLTQPKTLLDNASQVGPRIITEQVPLHWYVSNVTAIIWEAKPIISLELVTVTPVVRASAAADGAVLERDRTQWQFCDRESLTQLNRDTLQHLPTPLTSYPTGLSFGHADFSQSPTQ